MNIPNFENTMFIDRQGYLTSEWQLILQQLITQLQTGVGTEGYQVSIVSSDPASVDPPTAGGQLQRIEDSFGTQDGVIAGTVVFDPYEQNGAVLPARNGQLKVLLNDGTFHNITNT